jgi:hypothetical protein
MKKNCNIQKALHNNFLVNQIKIPHEFGVPRIEEFVKLWGLLQDVHLLQDVMDTITWKFTNDGKYSASSAYKMQFEA